MNFVYPGFLFALAAIAVPIVIHLFNFRRFKKVAFPDIRFLKQVEMQTRSRNELKHLLVLLSRILAIICLVLAFAQPVIPTAKEQETFSKSTVAIYVDNSFSMMAQGERGLLLEEATEKALEIADGFSGNTDLRLLTNAFDAAEMRQLSMQEFKEAATSIETTPLRRTLQEVRTRARGILGAEQPMSLFLISDLQTPQPPILSNEDTLTQVYLVPLSAGERANLYVDSCWFPEPVRLPEQPDRIMTRIRNAGNAPVNNLTVSLRLNGMQRAVSTTTVAAESFEDVELNYTNSAGGIQFGEVSLTDQPITYDDAYFFSYDLSNPIRVVRVTGENATTTVARLFDEETNIELTSVPATALDLSLFTDADLVITDQVERFPSGMTQELMQYVESGGDLLVIPAKDADLPSTNELLLAVGAELFDPPTMNDTLKVETLARNSSLYKNVFMSWDERMDLPKVYGYFPVVERVRSGAERLMLMQGAQPLLSAYRNGEATVHVLTAPLDKEWSNLSRHSILVPTLYNLALGSTGRASYSHTIGTDRAITVRNIPTGSDRPLEVRSVNEDLRFIPETVISDGVKGLLDHGQVKQAGHYLVMHAQDTVRPVSYNYDRNESLMSFTEPEQLTASSGADTKRISVLDQTVGALGNAVRNLHQDTGLWRIFLVLALLFLLAETILIRIL